MTNHENACALLGCPAACCRDITLVLSKHEAEQFLDGIQSQSLDPQDYEVSNLDEIASIRHGVYVIGEEKESDETVPIYIRGYCPYVNTQTMDCTIYTQKKRPGVCSDVVIGHPTCNSKRKHMGHPPLA